MHNPKSSWGFVKVILIMRIGLQVAKMRLSSAVDGVNYGPEMIKKYW